MYHYAFSGLQQIENIRSHSKMTYSTFGNYAKQQVQFHDEPELRTISLRQIKREVPLHFEEFYFSCSEKTTAK
jgi:hypothetical protein